MKRLRFYLVIGLIFSNVICGYGKTIKKNVDKELLFDGKAKITVHLRV